jgi:hypothetical protein
LAARREFGRVCRFCGFEMIEMHSR